MFREITKLAVYFLFIHPFSLTPLIHLVCPSKFCMAFFFSWVLQSSQEKVRTTFMQNLVGKTSEDVLCEISKWRIAINAREFHYCHITVEKKIIILLIKVDICRKNITCPRQLDSREPGQLSDLFRHSSFPPFPANFTFTHQKPGS